LKGCGLSKDNAKSHQVYLEKPVVLKGGQKTGVKKGGNQTKLKRKRNRRGETVRKP